LPLEVRRVPPTDRGLKPDVDVSKASRGTGPVFSWTVDAAKKSIATIDMLRGGDWSPGVRDEFISVYKDWITKARATPAVGLDRFPHAYFVDGVTQAYDLFFWRHAGRRFRTLEDEYPYTRLSVEHWLRLEDDEIRENDAVVLSCPFYCTGGMPRGYRDVLDAAARLGVPVMIDAAYFGTCYGTKLDYSHPAIEMVGFSLSKAFSVQSFRIGLLLCKSALKNLEEIQVQASYFNRIGAYVGIRLMREFSADFIPENYRSAQQAVCRELEVEPTHCVMLANLDHEDHRFDQLIADDRFEERRLPPEVKRRVCISRYLADPPPSLRQRASRVVTELRRGGVRSVLRRL
jgi:hypothetical protein